MRYLICVDTKDSHSFIVSSNRKEVEGIITETIEFAIDRVFFHVYEIVEVHDVTEQFNTVIRESLFRFNDK